VSQTTVRSDLAALYEGYFPDDQFHEKKMALAGGDSARAAIKLLNGELGKCLEVGAGAGAVTRALVEYGADDITALEISSTGLAKLGSLAPAVTVEQFDGYHIAHADQSFDTAVCAHVLEHVEHERLLLYEIRRVAKKTVFIVPLEGGLRGRIDRSGGHINYYTPLTFRNLIETSGYTILSDIIYSSCSQYEQHLYGPRWGSIRSFIRQSVKNVLGQYAPHVMVYVMAICAIPDNLISIDGESE
jgi:ubiquinone/menaquinone biosynthesis C-methylase UbiE